MSVSAQHQYEISFKTVDGDLDAKQDYFKGFKFWSPHIWDTRNRITSQEVPLSHISALRGDGMKQPLRLTFYGLKYYDTVILCMADIYRLQAYLSVYQDYYILFKGYHTISPYYFELKMLGKMISVIPSPVQGSQYTVWQPRIQWLAHDPFWYDSDSPINCNATMNTGNLVYCVATSALNNHWDQQRWTSKIKVNIDGHEIKNPKVESITDSSKWYQITGSLIDLDDYWLIDHMNGTVVEHDESAGTDTNVIDKFSGSFWALGPADAAIKITSDPTGDSDLRFDADIWKIWSQQ